MNRFLNSSICCSLIVNPAAKSCPPKFIKISEQFFRTLSRGNSGIDLSDAFPMPFSIAIITVGRLKCFAIFVAGIAITPGCHLSEYITTALFFKISGFERIILSTSEDIVLSIFCLSILFKSRS